MYVIKRNGTREPVQLDKIMGSITKTCEGLDHVEVMEIAKKTINGLYDGATTAEIDDLSIRTAVGLIQYEPQYQFAAARLLNNVINKELESQDIQSFSQAMDAGFRHGLINAAVHDFVKTNARKFNSIAKNSEVHKRYKFFGLKTVYDRYLLKNPETRQVIETPAYWLLRVAIGMNVGHVDEAIELFREYEVLNYQSSTPTMFNSATLHQQMSSCYLHSSCDDALTDIYATYGKLAQLKKWAGGIGGSWNNIRAEGALITGTNGLSNGPGPFLHTFDASVGAVNQGGKRKGAAAIYFETWHPDLIKVLDAKKGTADPAIALHNLNTASWIPDEFMRRVKAGRKWTLISPDFENARELHDRFGPAFDELYVELEAKLEAMERKPRWYVQVDAQETFRQICKSLIETGNGWMNWKDAANAKCNQVTPESGMVVHSSNLCTEILEVTDADEIAVCNLGSINLGNFVTTDGKIDYKRMANTVRVAVKNLNRVIDINFYPVPQAENSNKKWRPVGLGVAGLQDLYFKLRLPFISDEAAKVNREIFSFIYYHALKTSVEIAKVSGRFPAFDQTKTAKGLLQFDLWGVEPIEHRGMNWAQLKADIVEHGLANSLLMAIAPTATLGSILGAYECIEPQTNNMFKRETLSGEFFQINDYLVADLKKLGLWTREIFEKIKVANGSVQGVAEIPEEIRTLYMTAWEIPMRKVIDQAADRGPYLDQSQSLNTFMENANIGKVSSMYMYAWEKGLKTTYYLRTRAATGVAKLSAGGGSSTVAKPESAPAPTVEDEMAAIACSLENPEACEMCQ